MSTSLTVDATRRMDRFLAGKESLAQLRDWIRGHALTVLEDDGDADDERLIYDVELVLSEQEHGDWTPSEVRNRLREILPATTTLHRE